MKSGDSRKMAGGRKVAVSQRLIKMLPVGMCVLGAGSLAIPPEEAKLPALPIERVQAPAPDVRMIDLAAYEGAALQTLQHPKDSRAGNPRDGMPDTGRDTRGDTPVAQAEAMPALVAIVEESGTKRAILHIAGARSRLINMMVGDERVGWKVIFLEKDRVQLTKDDGSSIVLSLHRKDAEVDAKASDAQGASGHVPTDPEQPVGAPR